MPQICILLPHIFFKMPHIFVNAADFFKCRRFSFCFGRFSFGLFFSETDLRLVPQMTSKRLQRSDLVRHRRPVGSFVFTIYATIAWSDAKEDTVVLSKSATRRLGQTSRRQLLMCEVGRHHSKKSRIFRMPLLQLLHGNRLGPYVQLAHELATLL